MEATGGKQEGGKDGNYGAGQQFIPSIKISISTGNTSAVDRTRELGMEKTCKLDKLCLRDLLERFAPPLHSLMGWRSERNPNIIKNLARRREL